MCGFSFLTRGARCENDAEKQNPMRQQLPCLCKYRPPPRGPFCAAKPQHNGGFLLFITTPASALGICLPRRLPAGTVNILGYDFCPLRWSLRHFFFTALPAGRYPSAKNEITLTPFAPPGHTAAGIATLLAAPAAIAADPAFLWATRFNNSPPLSNGQKLRQRVP